MPSSHRLTVKRRTTARGFGRKGSGSSMIRTLPSSTMSSRVQTLKAARLICKSNTERFSQANTRIGCNLSVQPRKAFWPHAAAGEKGNDESYFWMIKYPILHSAQDSQERIAY